MLLIVCVIAYAISSGYDNRPQIVAAHEIVDRRFIAPDTYEIKYRDTFTTGKTTEYWREVSRNDYVLYKGADK